MANMYPTELLNLGSDPVLALMRDMAVQAGTARPLEQGLGQAMGRRAGMTAYDYDPVNVALAQMGQMRGPEAVIAAKTGMVQPADSRVLDMFIQQYGPERGLQEYEAFKNKSDIEKAKILASVQRETISAEARKNAGSSAAHEIAVGKLINGIISATGMPPTPEMTGQLRALITQLMPAQGGGGLMGELRRGSGEKAPITEGAEKAPKAKGRNPYKNKQGVWTDEATQSWLQSIGQQQADEGVAQSPEPQVRVPASPVAPPPPPPAAAAVPDAGPVSVGGGYDPNNPIASWGNLISAIAGAVAPQQPQVPTGRNPIGWTKMPWER